MLVLLCRLYYEDFDYSHEYEYSISRPNIPQLIVHFHPSLVYFSYPPFLFL